MRTAYPLMVAVVFTCIIGEARAETKYPVLAPRYAYAHQRHAGECRVGTVGTSFPTNAGCSVQVTASPAWVGDLGADRGILRFQYAFYGASDEEFAGIYFTFGRSAVETVTTNGAAGPDIDLHADGTFNLNRLPLTGDAPGAIDAVRISLRQLSPYTNLMVRVELEDANRVKGYIRFPFAPSNSTPITIDLLLSSFSGGFDPTDVKILSLVVEENHWLDGIHNPPASGFDLLQIELVDYAGEGRDAAWVSSLSDRAFVYELARRDFETLWRLSDAATGACMDRTMFRDLLHWGATGWLLASLPFAVEQGWISVAEAEARALQILRFLDNDAIWGDTPAGKVGNSLGLMYRFGGIDAAGLLGPLTGTRKIDLNKVNAVEASTIDTALFMMGAATCASGFSDVTANQTEIRSRVASLLSRTRWDELVDPTTRQFYMAWKPEIDTSTTSYATPAAFGGYWASANASGSRALTIDYWTAEGAMAALLAVGSATHATSPELWYTMHRQVNPHGVLTWPGAWFTYAFLQSTYLDPGQGPDRGTEYGVRTVDWLTNTVAAFDVYKGLSGPGGIVLPDAVELPDITYEAQGLTNMAVGESVRFTGTLTPYSLQMAIGLGDETATAAISSLKQMLVQTPEMWDPLVGLLDSCHTNLATFPNAVSLLRQAGPWIQQQKWPLNCGAALLSELNYLTTGGVWRAAMRSGVLSNGVERIYRQARTNGLVSVVMSIPGGNDAWSCAISGNTVIFPDGYQEVIHFYDSSGTYLGEVGNSAIGDALAAADVAVERSTGPAGLRDAATLPNGDFIVLVAGPGTDALLRVTTNRIVNVLASSFGEAMDRGDDISNFPRVAVGGTNQSILVTVNTPVQGVAVLGLDGVLSHVLVLGNEYHGLAVERGSNRLFLLRSDGQIQAYADFMVPGLTPSVVASLPFGISGRDLAYSVTWWTDRPALLAAGSDGHLYRIPFDNPVVEDLTGTNLTGVWGLDVSGSSGVLARDETGAFESFIVARSPLELRGPLTFIADMLQFQVSGSIGAYLRMEVSTNLINWSTEEYHTLQSEGERLGWSHTGTGHAFFRAIYEY